jgi:hypothetical protein
VLELKVSFEMHFEHGHEIGIGMDGCMDPSSLEQNVLARKIVVVVQKSHILDA